MSLCVLCYVLVKPPSCHGNVKHIPVCTLCSSETSFLSWGCEEHLCVLYVLVKLPFCHGDVKNMSVLYVLVKLLFCHEDVKNIFVYFMFW